ncbi:nuclear speckle splicing regulatory protein 1 [Drosophila rhopaloa]|uniref:Nuclear speckle splicing regulatory protein 1 n=1 Tax=Drosophila rhopaloa TaxID=1041015 RepID=A0A6P4F3Z6_DRORH|nr:nuclear speckle splicing regulatory protein 1 [Drosophila rhopaloa]
MSKQYGLIISGQQKKVPAKPVKPAIFDESSASESDDDRNAPQLKSKTGVTSGPSLMERRVARRQQEKALAEDPTIFQYDELYDDMDNKREEAKQSKSNEPRKPKYIGRLMEHAERRKLEKELRIERQVQKDREAEGEMYKDKDTYVTAAYRKKLESIRQMQEQEQRDEYLEAIGDVTKQKDLDGFYRHLYEQKLGPAGGDVDVVKPKTAPSTDEVSYKPIKAEVVKHRSYRQRRPSEEEEDDVDSKAKSGRVVETTTSADQAESKPAQAHLANNIDADSDFSIDDSSDDEAEDKDKDKKNDEVKQQQAQEKSKEKDKPQQSLKATKENETAAPTGSPDKKEDSDAELDEKDLPVPIVTKPPVDRTLIWRKRTVGDVFDAALARYQERKRARQG